jgi:hypothetical protein
MALRTRLLRAADRLLPAPVILWDHALGISRTHVLGAFAELGVADALGDERRTAAELAPELGADADMLHRLMRAAAVQGIVRLDRRGRFRLTHLGRALRSDAELSARPLARFMAMPSMVSAWTGFTDGVRDGRSAFRRVHGDSIWDWFSAHPDEGEIFGAAMRSFTLLDAPAIAKAGLWPDEGTICDVGGGIGTLLAAVLAERPNVRGVLVDAPVMMPLADENLTQHGLRGRVELIPGDLFGELSAEADVYVLKNVLHDWDDATCIRILRSVRATMRQGARLVVIEQLQEPNRPHPLASPGDILMFIQCDEGRERSRDELQQLMRSADLRPGRVERASAAALLEATA